jgi:hypothetical protein
MIIPTKPFENNRVYPPDEQEYDKLMDQIWLYERWAKRANKRVPEIAGRVFCLRHVSYMGRGFHYGMERRLGKILVKINDYDDCPCKPERVFLLRISMKVALRSLFEEVVAAEKSAKRW